MTWPYVVWLTLLMSSLPSYIIAALTGARLNGERALLRTQTEPAVTKTHKEGPLKRGDGASGWSAIIKIRQKRGKEKKAALSIFMTGEERGKK